MPHSLSRSLTDRGDRPLLIAACLGSHQTRRRASARRLLFLAILIALALGTTGCDQERQGDQVVVTGSTTILPIAEQAAEGFTDTHEGTQVLVSGLGSSAGIEAVTAGTSDIGTASRDLKDEEEGKGLVDIPIAFDGIAVIVNPANPVKALTTEQLRQIFSGEITNWQQVGGENREIDLVNRDEASGTREAFKKIVMGEDAHFDRGAVVLPGTGQVRDVVSRSEGAIGYISVGFVASRFGSGEVKSLVVDGIQPSEKTVADKTYPIARTLHYFTKGEPTGLTKEYIDYVLSEEVQNGVVVDAGFVPVSVGAEQ